MQFSAIKMLLSRLTIVIKYVNAVEEGELEFNHAIMRDVKGLVDRFPVSIPTRNTFEKSIYDHATIECLGSGERQLDARVLYSIQ